MKDLDFDELDRAVNSLIGNKTSSVTPAEPLLTAPAPQAELAPVASPLLIEPSEDKPVQALPLAARRTSGRFMDVVHPSSDMRSTSMPTRPMSRVGTTIQAPKTVQGAYGSPSTPETVVESTSSKPDTTTSPEWPDPIDFHGFDGEKKEVVDTIGESPVQTSVPEPQEAVLEVDEDSDISKLADDINATLAGTTEQPLNSPFLSDAKVEKRPLGTFSLNETTTPEVPAPIVVPPVVVKPEAETPEAVSTGNNSNVPTETNTPMPAELQDDLLQLESDNVTLPAPEVKAVEDSAPIGPTSITQQYKEQPSTSDQPTGAIFDTHAYQKPLAHPAKKKSGWTWVIWTLALIIVGAGAGAAVYFFVLPLL